jgi:hypothetical protein
MKKEAGIKVQTYKNISFTLTFKTYGHTLLTVFNKCKRKSRIYVFLLSNTVDVMCTRIIYNNTFVNVIYNDSLLLSKRTRVRSGFAVEL